MLILGYAGLIIGFGCLGILKAMHIRKRPQEIRELINALALLDTEIFWGVTPLPQAFCILKERTEPPWAGFFHQLELELKNGNTILTTWDKVIKEQQKKFSLHDEDWRIVKGIGKGLGRSDRSEQHKILELAKRQLTQADETARQQVDSKAKMWSYLGFLGGMTVVIFIM